VLRARRNGLLAAVAVALSGLTLAGCGLSQAPIPNLSQPRKPEGWQGLFYPKDGVALLYPRGWDVAPQKSPLITVVSSGPAVIALWRYSRSGPTLTGAALSHAEGELIKSVRAHDPSVQVIRTGTTTLDGVGAVELDAIERISGSLRRVRSEHIYPAGSELVLEEYSPPSMFSQLDHEVFSPVRKKLTLITAHDRVL
jgi:hypothetical protein